jgi:hypothetical protein
MLINFATLVLGPFGTVFWPRQCSEYLVEEPALPQDRHMKDVEDKFDF